MFIRLLRISGLCVLIAMFAATVIGQVEGQPYRLSDDGVEKIISRIEQGSDKFRDSLDAALDKSRFDGSNQEDDINSFVKAFYERTKTLRDRFDDKKSTAPDVQAVLDSAARIDNFMQRNRLSSQAHDDWTTLKTHLDELAAAYSVSWRWLDYGTGNPRDGGGYPVQYPAGTTVSGIPYRVTDREVEQILRRIEEQSDKFRSALDDALDKSRLNGTHREDEINAFVKDFYAQTKTLRDHFDDHKSTSADVQSVLDRASRIDDFMRRNRLRNAEREWRTLRPHLDELARVYNVTWRWRY